MGRFINADAFASTGQGLLGNNMFAYCLNSPVIYNDTSGCFADYVIDWGFIVWGAKETIEDPSAENVICFAVDLVFAVVPFVPSGAGQIIKGADKIKDGYSALNKATVIGETMDRVRNFAQHVGALGNLYDGFKWYTKLAELGSFGKVLAEIGGKTSNALWLLSKLRTGYTVFDIGIDANRTLRSSSYMLEQVVSFVWETRNAWKSFLHTALGE